MVAGMFRRVRVAAVCWAIATLSSGGCSPSDAELFVELKTDLIPGAEFGRVRTILLPAEGGTAGREQDALGLDGVDYLAGQRVAEFDDITPGNMVVRVELFGPDGRQFMERSVRIDFRGSAGITVVITRSCRGVSCPDDSGIAALTECLGGRCVSPDCRTGDEPECGEPQCRDSGDCITPASCAAALCERGVCFARALVDGCPSGQYCDAAVGCLGLPSVPDGGAADAGDAGDAGGCTTNADCDDAIDCTTDTCDAGACVRVADDALCTAGTDGECIDGFGCQYDGCTAATCVAGACETARCDGDTCLLEPSCDAEQMCCGDACVPAGCDDDNPCTDDACGATGCENTPSAASCDDSVFCNGTDTCASGSCTVHAGDPCGGGTTCDESGSSCVGCLADGDCPDDILGPFGACSGFSGTCDETGTRSRTRTSFTCVGGTCVPSDTMETEACGRSTTGVTCGTTTFGTWGACGGFSGTCGESGTRSRTRTARTCSAATCQDDVSVDTGSCSRDTDGSSCGTTTFGAWGACGGFSDTCDESGTRSRTQTDFFCVAGSCDTQVGTDVGACSRSTTGTVCGATMFGVWGPCGGFSSTCDETGTRSRSQTERLCESSACQDVPGTDSEACLRMTAGSSCNDFPASCRTGTCSGGSCSFLVGSGCTGTNRCCEPGICVCSSCECP
jgi:hypothetical protein